MQLPYCPVYEAIWVCIEQVENSVLAALGYTHGQENNTKRVKFQYYHFLVIKNVLYFKYGRVQISEMPDAYQMKGGSDHDGTVALLLLSPHSQLSEFTTQRK